GASRGIGLAIALAAARDGANIAIAAKTDAPHPKLPGTIHTAAAEIEAAGGRALALAVDVRDEGQVKSAIERAASHFGGLDIVVNNASVISLTPTAATDVRRFDLMHQVNTRGSFMVSKYAIPFLARAANPHILMLSPPLDMQEKWFAPHTAYSIAKFGMSLVVLGLAGELRAQGIAVNALWPRTTIATAAIKNLLGGDEVMRRSRRPDILADAAYAIFAKPAKSFTGKFLIDDTFLAAEGMTDFDRYRVDPGMPLAPDFFVPDDSLPPRGVTLAAGTPSRDAGRGKPGARAQAGGKRFLSAQSMLMCAATRVPSTCEPDADALHSPPGLPRPHHAARPSRAHRPPQGDRADARGREIPDAGARAGARRRNRHHRACASDGLCRADPRGLPDRRHGEHRSGQLDVSRKIRG